MEKWKKSKIFLNLELAKVLHEIKECNKEWDLNVDLVLIDDEEISIQLTNFDRSVLLEITSSEIIIPDKLNGHKKINLLMYSIYFQSEQNTDCHTLIDTSEFYNVEEFCSRIEGLFYIVAYYFKKGEQNMKYRIK